jgi:trk system potassium uptake protein TrkA
MNVIIIGGGRTGAQLARTLLAEGHQIVLVEERPQIIDRLYQELPKNTVVQGDGSSPTVLERAGIRNAQVLAAVTSEDEANLVIATLGRFEFGVPRIIARVNNPMNAWLFTPDMGVDVALNQADILAKLIAEEMSLGDMTTLLKLRKGEFSIVEEKVHPEAEVAGKALKEIKLPAQSRVVVILRKGKMIIPEGSTVLQPVDELICIVHSSSLKQLANMLGKMD